MNFKEKIKFITNVLAANPDIITHPQSSYDGYITFEEDEVIIRYAMHPWRDYEDSYAYRISYDLIESSDWDAQKLTKIILADRADKRKILLQKKLEELEEKESRAREYERIKELRELAEYKRLKEKYGE